MGIEPTYSAWKAAALPLSYTRDVAPFVKIPHKRQRGFCQSNRLYFINNNFLMQIDRAMAKITLAIRAIGL